MKSIFSSASKHSLIVLVYTTCIAFLWGIFAGKITVPVELYFGLVMLAAGAYFNGSKLGTPAVENK